MGRRRVPEGSHVVVDLVDDDAPSPVPTEHEGTATPRRPVPRRRWVVAGLLVLVLAVAATGADRWLTRQRFAALAGVPGILTPMTTSPAILWELPDARLLGATDDLVVVSAPEGVRAVDAGTGETRWSLALDGRHAQWCSTVPEQTVTVLPGVGAASGHRSGDRSGHPSDEPSDHLAVCEVVARAGMVGTAGPLSQAPVVTSGLLAIDLRTGAAVADLGLPGPVAATAAHEGDLVVAVRDISGRLQVLRWDPSTGSERWRWLDADGVVDPSAGVSVGIGDVVAWFEGRAGLTADRRAGVTVDLATGDATIGTAASGVWRDVELATLGDGTVVRALRPWAAGTARAEVTRPDGDAGVVRDRQPLLPAVDADRGDPVLVTQGSSAVGLRGVELDDGRAIWWTADVTVDGPVVHVDGAVVVPGEGGRYAAVDLADGEVLWSRDVGEGLPSGGLTDGALVLVPARDDVGQVLVALGARDGLPRWRLPLPEGTERVDEAAGRVVVSTDRGLVVLGSAASG